VNLTGSRVTSLSRLKIANARSEPHYGFGTSRSHRHRWGPEADDGVSPRSSQAEQGMVGSVAGPVVPRPDRFKIATSRRPTCGPT